MKRFLCLLLLSLLSFTLAACNTSGQLGNEPPAGVGEQHDSAGVPLSPVASQPVQEDAVKGNTPALEISVQSGGNTVIFALNDSSAAQELYAQLPLTIQVEDYGSNEKIFYPPQKLAAANTPLASTSSQAGTLAYYEPWGDVVMFYDSFAPASGLYELGHAVSGGETISALSGTVEITPYNAGEPAAQPGRTLLVYFSHTGTTGTVAQYIAQAADVDVFEIVPVEPYPINYSDTLSLAQSELDADARPAIQTQTLNLDKYDTILLGYPIWHGTFPMPVATFLESHSFTGKQIAPFCTSGSTTITRSEAHIAELAPGAEVLQGLGITSSSLSNAEAMVTDWLSAIGLV